MRLPMPLAVAAAACLQSCAPASDVAAVMAPAQAFAAGGPSARVTARARQSGSAPYAVAVAYDVEEYETGYYVFGIGSAPSGGSPLFLGYSVSEPPLLTVGQDGTLYLAEGSSILEYQGSTLVRTIALGGATEAATMVVADNYLYVAEEPRENAVTVYAPGATTPLMTITDGVVQPGLMAVDGKNRVYVVNNNGTITVYPLAKRKRLETISQGLNDLISIAAGASNVLYVAKANPTEIVAYPYGHLKPTRTITAGLSGLSQIFTDGSGTVYALNQPSVSTITEYDNGGTTLSRTIRGTKVFSAVAVHPSGYVYAAYRGIRPFVLDYAPHQTKVDQKSYTYPYLIASLAPGAPGLDSP